MTDGSENNSFEQKIKRDLKMRKYGAIAFPFVFALGIYMIISVTGNAELDWWVLAWMVGIGVGLFVLYKTLEKLLTELERKLNFRINEKAVIGFFMSLFILIRVIAAMSD